MTRRTALLAGATGLVGGHCLDLLLQDDAWEQVTVLGRREIGTTHRKLVQRVVDFDRLAELGDVPRGDDVFYCLGTSARAQRRRSAGWTSPMSTSWRSSPPGSAPASSSW